MHRRRLLRSSTLRLTLLYAGVFAASTAGLLGFMAWSATSHMARQIDETVSNELAEVQATADGDEAAVRRIVERLVVRSPGVFYLLQNASGTPEAGNMQPVRPLLGPRVLKAARRGGVRGSGIRGRGVFLPSGAYLFVGLSAYELGEMQEVLLRSTAGGLAVILLIATGGGLATSVWLLRRIDAIAVASHEIMAGDFDRRIPLGGSGDEFDRLSTSLNDMLDRIQELMRGLQQVSSDIAHDLRTPLTRLRQRLELASRRSATAADYETAVNDAIVESEAILDLFAALLRIAQVESGTRRAGFAAVDLSSLATDVAEAYRPDLEAAARSLTTAIAPELIIHGDGELITQVLANLVENTLRHCPQGTRVCLNAFRNRGGVEVSVVDDGPGIPSEFRQMVVQRFTRLERSRTTPGSGLGLSLVSAVAVIHGSQLVLEDNQPGLRCSLVFPVTAAG